MTGDDWRARAKARGAELVQKAAQAGGTQVEILGSLVANMHMHFAEEMHRLSERVGSVESHGLKYAGVWQRAMDYQRGDVVTHKGSAWVALGDGCVGSPGEDSAWQLMVKKGKDAA